MCCGLARAASVGRRCRRQPPPMGVSATAGNGPAKKCPIIPSGFGMAGHSSREQLQEAHARMLAWTAPSCERWRTTYGHSVPSLSRCWYMSANAQFPPTGTTSAPTGDCWTANRHSSNSIKVLASFYTSPLNLMQSYSNHIESSNNFCLQGGCLAGCFG